MMTSNSSLNLKEVASVGKVHSLLIALTIISELTLSSLFGTGTFLNVSCTYVF